MQRRNFLSTSLVLVGGASLPRMNWKEGSSVIRFGIVSDVHYANKKAAGNRHYKQSLAKLTECVNTMNEERVDFLVELGDFKDDSNPPNEKQTLQFLDTIEKVLQRFNGPCYHVLGNHDEDCISKEQFLGRVRNGSLPKADNFYSFEKQGFQFIVLDANFNPDGSPYDKGNFDWRKCHIPEKQLDWMRDQLQNKLPSVIFIHERLDRFYSLRNFCPDNADKAREILESAGNVIAVFQGHDHRGGFNVINNIGYYTSKGVIEGSGPENNSYAIVEITKDFEKKYVTKIIGYRKERSVIF
jgi:predicted phosphodiesterase